ncbi:MAG: 3-isopropylmalate dehydratase [Planctomycetes bacterium]|nr:3-isopropylmalate dehydratase [Planctomycetota bacterium]
MIERLQKLSVSKRLSSIKLRGRILFLTEDPELIRRQLRGEDLRWEPSLKLRDDISTDEITPAWICYHYDDRLGDFPYTGLKCGGVLPIGEGDVRRGGFVACVSGKRRGKGSSREQSPYAEMAAGIRIVIAENIERIYRQNCQNLGMLVCSDFDLIDAIRAGKEIPLARFTAGEDLITRQIVEYGGLFEFNVARARGEAEMPALARAPRPLNLAEKIIARHMVADLKNDRVGAPVVRPGDAGFVRTDIRFSHEYVTPMAAMAFEARLGAEARVRQPSSVIFFRDHLTFLADVMPPEKAHLLRLAGELAAKQQRFAALQGITLHGETKSGGSEAICHAKVLGDYAAPGQVIIGSDSPTPHSGAIGCLAFGVGTTAVFNGWVTQDTRITVPESVLIKVEGERAAGVTAKDFMLRILAHPQVKSGAMIGKIVEYGGSAVRSFDIDERATMTNMAAEIGAFTGIVAPDDKTVEFLAARGLGRAAARRLCSEWQSDPGCEYADVIEIAASEIEPLVATPGDPGNGVPVRSLGEVKIDIAYGGSCTAGKKADMDMYARVLKRGLEQGRRVHPEVAFWIQFGSAEVKRYCQEKGYLELFEQAGARTIEPSCGACINAGPGVSTKAAQVTISAINRNFPGRSGPGQMYLASPLTVAASALAGKIVAFDA